MSDYPTTVLATTGLAAYWRLGVPFITSPASLSIPGSDGTYTGGHVNDLAGTLSLSAGDTLMVHLTTALSANQNLGLWSSNGGVNSFSSDTGLPIGWYAFTVPSTQTDYHLYSYNGNTYRPGMTGAGTVGVGGPAAADLGPNSLGLLQFIAGSNIHFPTFDDTNLLIGGQSGASCTFTGAGSSVLLHADNNHLDLGDAYSMAFLFKPASVSGTRCLVSKGAGAYAGRANGTSLETIRDNTTVLAASSGLTLVNGTTYHIVITKNGSATKIWVDGVDKTGSVSNQTATDTTDQLWIGADRGTSGDWANGSIQEVALFSAALSSGDVAALYAATNNAGGGGGGGSTARVSVIGIVG